METGKTFNFNDLFKKDFLKMDIFGKISIDYILLGMFVALLIGLLIFVIYKKNFRGVVYSHNFNISLVLMTLITTLIVMTISTNVVLSLGMVGALSIVRFRTAVKDPLDIVYLFWSISAGITTGAGVYLLAISGSIFIAIVIVLLTRKRGKDTLFLLIVHYDETGTDEVKYHLGRIKHSLKSKIVRAGETELTVELRMKGDNTAFVNQLSVVTGVRDVSLVQYNGDFAL